MRGGRVSSGAARSVIAGVVLAMLASLVLLVPAPGSAAQDNGRLTPIVVAPIPQKSIVPVEGSDDRWHVMYYSGDRTDPNNWFGYGAPIIAAKKGVVTEARDGMPDQPPGTMPSNLKFDDLPGNYVAVEMKGGFTAVYAHLKPGSVAVEAATRFEPARGSARWATAARRSLRTSTSTP